MLYLLEALHLGDDVLPIYLGDDVTDEHAFAALRDRGLSLVVHSPSDWAEGARTTAADYRLDSVEEVGHFLDMLAR